TPYNDLTDVVAYVKPNLILTVLTQPFKETTALAYLSQLSATFPEVQILAAGSQVFFQDQPQNNQIRFFKSTKELDMILVQRFEQPVEVKNN
ncbi:MAG TPA: hypothetical protein VF691_11300, partial [Cytophagaceae bacterium]